MTKHQSPSAFPQVLDTVVSKTKHADGTKAPAKSKAQTPPEAPRSSPRLPRVASSS